MSESARSSRRPTGWRSAIDWWYRPLAERETWLALASLFVGALWAVVMFTVGIVLMVVTAALVLAVIGLLLIRPAFAALGALVGVERRRASWTGASIPPRPVPSAAVGARRSWSRRIVETATDPERWRQVGFVCAYVVVAPMLFALAVAPVGGLLGLFFSTVTDLGSIDVAALTAGVLLAGAVPRIISGATAAERAVVAWFLGPDPTADLQERVDELSEQRTLILEAVASERRRIERDLHDGVQQQLVALGIDVGIARRRLDDDPAVSAQLLDEALVKVRSAVGELRVIGRGLHPAVLDDRGLDAALSAIVARSPIPVAVDVQLVDDVPDDLAATAYYVVNEAVANILKHARARTGSVNVADEHIDGGRRIVVTVRDDGCGGADASTGTGLAGIRARVEAFDGSLQIDSPSGGPTTLVAVLHVPLPTPTVD